MVTPSLTRNDAAYARKPLSPPGLRRFGAICGVGLHRQWRRLLVTVAALVTSACGNSVYIRGGFDAVVDLDQPAWRLLLIGDGGTDNLARSSVLAAASSYVSAAPERTAVVWLGDNLYTHGLPADDESQRGQAVLGGQMEVATDGARAFFVPGNHDWDHSGKRGLARIRAAGRFIATRSASAQAPADGCPGPVWVDLEARRGSSVPGVRLVFVDTEWLLTSKHPRGWEGCSWGPIDAGPEYEGNIADPEQVYAQLAAGLQEAAEHGLLAVVVGHHPIYTAGSHGGFFPADEWLFSTRMLKKWAWIPIPLLGVAARKIGGSIKGQDLSGGANKAMVRGLQSAFVESPPLLYAAGHEHDLQVFADPGGRPSTYVVSGSASKSAPTGQRQNSLFKSREHGFMVVDGLGARIGGGQARLRVVAVDPKTGRARIPFCAELERNRPAVAC